MDTCQIQWVDDKGDPTPDDNRSIGRVRSKETVELPASRWFHICWEHAQRLENMTPAVRDMWEWEL